MSSFNTDYDDIRGEVRVRIKKGLIKEIHIHLNHYKALISVRQGLEIYKYPSEC